MKTVDIIVKNKQNTVFKTTRAENISEADFLTKTGYVLANEQELADFEKKQKVLEDKLQEELIAKREAKVKREAAIDKMLEAQSS